MVKPDVVSDVDASSNKEAINASGALNRAGPQFRRNDRLNRLQFFGGVHAEVDLRGADIGVTEPQRDLSNVVGGLQHEYRTTMPKLMRRHRAIA